jgi:SSS family solute:Na+ symporter
MDITILVIIAYLIAMIITGICIKRCKDSSEYSTAKHSLTIAAVTTGLVMTHFGGGFILGGAELGYKYGIYGLVYAVSASLGVLVLGIVLSKRIYKESKKNNIKTIPSFLFFKFKDRKVSFVAALLSILSLTAIASAQLFASIQVFSALGIPTKISCAAITLVVILIATKGMKALTMFGKYNLIIATVGAIAAILLASNSAPIIKNFEFQPMPLGYLAGILFSTVMYTMIGQDFHQKLYSAKSEKVVKNSYIYASIILFLLGFFPVIIGMTGASLFSIQASEAMPKFILFTMPSILKGLFIAAILAALIGSAQSVINAAATQVSEDLFKNIKKYSDKQLGKVASISAAVLSVIAFVIAVFSSSIINNLIIAYTIYTAGMFVPIMAAFYLKKPKRYSKAALLISILGILISLLFELKIIKTGIPSIIPSIIISLAVLLLVILKVSYSKVMTKGKIYKLTA